MLYAIITATVRRQFSRHAAKLCRAEKEARIVNKNDYQARKLNKEDAMDRCKWRKMIKEAR